MNGVVIGSMVWLGVVVVFYKDALGAVKAVEQSYTSTGLGQPHPVSVSKGGVIKWVAGYAGLFVVLALLSETGAEELASALAVLIATSATAVLGPTALQNFQKLGQ